MKTPVPSILNTITENKVLRRIATLEEQVKDLADCLRINGIAMSKCDFCSRPLVITDCFCHCSGPTDLRNLGSFGISIVGLRDGRYHRYYCTDHLLEALEDSADWAELDGERAKWTIAHFLLVHGTNHPRGSNPPPVRHNAANYPQLKAILIDKMQHLSS